MRTTSRKCDAASTNGGDGPSSSLEHDVARQAECHLSAGGHDRPWRLSEIGFRAPVSRRNQLGNGPSINGRAEAPSWQPDLRGL